MVLLKFDMGALACGMVVSVVWTVLVVMFVCGFVSAILFVFEIKILI